MIIKNVNEPTLMNSMDQKNINHSMAETFVSIHSKLNYNLKNNTTSLFSFEILENKLYKELFKTVLIEIEILILNLESSKLTQKQILEKSERIFCDLVNNCLTVYSKKLQRASAINNIINPSLDVKLLEYFTRTHGFAFKQLLQTLTTKNTMPNGTNYLLLEPLIDNFIVVISNYVIYTLLNQPVKKSFETSCDFKFIQTRTVEQFRNSISLELFLERTFYNPKAQYESKYPLLILSRSGIFCRYIYMKTDNIKGVFVVFLELKDFITPVTTKIFTTTRKVVVKLSKNITKQCIYFIQNKIS